MRRPFLSFRPWSDVPLILSVVVLGGLLLMPVYACGCSSKQSSMKTACMSNQKQIALGLILYAGDYDERLPGRDAWVDRIGSYVKEEKIFHDHARPKGEMGYAFNAALDLAKAPNDAKIPMTYDSVNPIRNASDRVTSLPAGGRHKGKNVLSYTDGHVKAVAPPAVRR